MSTPTGQTPLSPLPITSRPVRARLDWLKADMSAEYQVGLGRDATWNEVLQRLLDAYKELRPGAFTRKDPGSRPQP